MNDENHRHLFKARLPLQCRLIKVRDRFRSYTTLWREVPQQQLPKPNSDCISIEYSIYSINSAQY